MTKDLSVWLQLRCLCCCYLTWFINNLSNLLDLHIDKSDPIFQPPNHLLNQFLVASVFRDGSGFSNFEVLRLRFIGDCRFVNLMMSLQYPLSDLCSVSF